MTSVEDRVTTLEKQMVPVQERLTMEAGLAASRDRDVSDVKVKLQAQTGLLNALRLTQVEQGETLAEHGKKLEEHDRRFDRVDAQLGELKSDVGVLKSDVGVLKSEMAEVKVGVRTIIGLLDRVIEKDS
jgi:hypothetical protein